MDMINTWLNDFAQWGKIFGGAAKFIEGLPGLSTVFNFLKVTEAGEVDSPFSTAWEGLGKAFEGSAPKGDA